jgi:surface repeat SSSPR-51 protein
LKKKVIALSALALAQSVGTVALVQNSIVQTYAEQKNKDVTSQQFLNYIKELKQKYPSMKFEENTTVYNSLQEAQQAEQQQKQQLSQSISEYEQALKQQQDTYNQQNASVIEQNKQIEQANKVKQDEYEQKKQQYETDLANFENTKNEYEDWYRDQKQQLDIGIAKLVGDFDDTQAGSLRFYQNLTLTYDKDKLAESGTEVTDEDIKFTPGKSSISNVQSDSEARITNNQADSEGRKYVTRFDLGIGITPGTKATFDLHNIGTTKSGKIISAHVKFVLDKTTDVNTQFGVVPNRLLAIYFYNNRTADQKGHFEVEFFDEATGEPMKLITAFVSSDIDGVTEKNYVGSDGKIDGKIPTLRSDPRSNKYPEIGNVSANELYYAGKADHFDIDRESATPYGQGLTLTSGSKLTLGFGVGADEYGAYSDFSLVKIGSKTKEKPTKPVAPEQPTLTPLVDVPEKPEPIKYNGNNTITYTRFEVKQLTTEWVDEDGKELKPLVTDDTIKEHGDIEGYYFAETETKPTGDVVHKFRQIVTTFVTEDGKEVFPQEKGKQKEKPHKDYSYKKTETDEHGNVEHIYHMFHTDFVDEDMNKIADREDGAQNQKDVPGYIYVRSESKPDKDLVTHIYKQVTTSWLDENGKELKPVDKGSQPHGEFTGYTYIKTETDKSGNTIHTFKKASKEPTNDFGIIGLTVTSVLSLMGIKVLNKKKREA